MATKRSPFFAATLRCNLHQGPTPTLPWHPADNPCRDTSTQAQFLPAVSCSAFPTLPYSGSCCGYISLLLPSIRLCILLCSIIFYSQGNGLTQIVYLRSGLGHFPVNFVWSGSPGILSLISMVFLWGLYNFSMVILCNFYGVSMIFYGGSTGVSMVVLWYSYGGSTGCLCDFLWIPMGVLWYFYDISRWFLWEFSGVSIRFLWNFYGGSMIFLWDFHWIPMGFPWCVNDFSIGLLWDVWGNSMGFLWDFFVDPMLFPCYFYDLWSFYEISAGFLWDFRDISMGFLWDVNWKQVEIQLNIHLN